MSQNDKIKKKQLIELNELLAKIRNKGVSLCDYCRFNGNGRYDNEQCWHCSTEGTLRFELAANFLLD